MTAEITEPAYEQLKFAPRYYIQTAKNAIESLAHIAEEVASNEDEAITRRAHRDHSADSGKITFRYDPGTMMLDVTGDGDGMTAQTMRERLKTVGEAPHEAARRGFFDRGVREVFLAMGGGEIISIGVAADGQQVLSRAVFDPSKGMALVAEDRTPSAEDRSELGLPATGTRVRIPVRRFALQKPRLYEFGSVESQIRDCVGLRPVLTDPARQMVLEYGTEPPRTLRFEYPDGEDLVAPKDVSVGGYRGTFWAKIAPRPIKGASRRTRKNGILIRGERAAYEVSLGENLRNHPAMSRVFGELKMPDIERLQRQADKNADDESLLIYKTDRSGLNPEHPLVEAIHRFIDQTLGPLISDLDANETKKKVSPDMRRQLQKLAREINHVLSEDSHGLDAAPAGTAKPRTDEDEKDHPPKPPLPPAPPPEPRYVEDGIGFARDRIFIEADRSRTVKVWFDVSKIPTLSPARVTSRSDEIVENATLSRHAVPEPAADGIAELDLAVRAGAVEGRHEVVVESNGYSGILPVHVRFPRAGGFISQIIPDPIDWEAGSALWDPATGVVRVFVGRPEFKDAAARARKDKQPDPWKDSLYRQLVVESVREAALWPAAARRAEVEWDELPPDQRQDSNGFYNLVQTAYQELDYMLRSKLLSVFVEP
jgi:hypothetical protein